MLTTGTDFADTVNSYHIVDGQNTKDTFVFTAKADSVTASNSTFNNVTLLDMTQNDGDKIDLTLYNEATGTIGSAAGNIGSGAKIAGIETLNILSNGAAGITFDNTLEMSAVDTLKVSGSFFDVAGTGFHFNGTGASSKVISTLKTIDASGIVGGTVILDAGSGTQDLTILGPNYAAKITGGDGNDIITGQGTIEGGDGDDTITLTGASTVKDGSGNDTVNGSDGNDTFINGSGADVFTGGAGADKFDFSTAVSTKAEMDTITDFSGVTGGQKDQIMLGTWDNTNKAVAYSGNKTTFDEILKDLSNTAAGAGTKAEFVIDFANATLGSGSGITVTDPTGTTDNAVTVTANSGEKKGSAIAELFSSAVPGNNFGYTIKVSGTTVTFTAKTVGKVASPLTATSDDDTNFADGVKVTNGPNGMGSDPAEGTPANNDIVYFELDGNTYAAQIASIASGFAESTDFLVQLTGTNLGLDAADFAQA